LPLPTELQRSFVYCAISASESGPHGWRKQDSAGISKLFLLHIYFHNRKSPAYSPLPMYQMYMDVFDTSQGFIQNTFKNRQGTKKTL
jgi:hypothetical protein